MHQDRGWTKASLKPGPHLDVIVSEQLVRPKKDNDILQDDATNILRSVGGVPWVLQGLPVGDGCVREKAQHYQVLLGWKQKYGIPEKKTEDDFMVLSQYVP